MEIIVQPDAVSACRLVAEMIARVVERTPTAVLGLATGGTVVPVYEVLVQHHRQGLSFEGVHTFNLDEYVGIDVDHPASFRHFMHQHFFSLVDIPTSHIGLLDGTAADVDAECRRFESAIVAAGGIDLQLLGIGTDGHIGFNEPSSSLGSRTRIKTLTKETRASYAAAFGGEALVPKHVLTMGVGTIAEARACVLLALGSQKAAAVAAAVEGPITAMIPASALQLHPNTTMVLDVAAASKLQHRAYYDDVYSGKPAWQRE